MGEGRGKGEGSSHLDPFGRLRMVDVSAKPVTRRRAVAACRVSMSAEALEALREGTAPKGDVLAVAQVAGIQAAKRTPDLLPGCHPLPIEAVELDFDASADDLEVRAEVRGEARTGFEMEALVACAVAALTVHDMLKGLDPGIVTGGLHLLHKEGGRSSGAARGS